MRIIFHDVPQDRAITYWYHGLRDLVRIFPQSCTEAAAKKDYFHNFLVDLVK